MIEAWLEQAVGTVWNYPVVGLCLFTGIFFTLRLAFIQFRCFPHAIGLISGKYDNPNEKGHITHFQALSAALSGTIGLGNIAGVAIAIGMGGPGAVFWMWIIAIFGMATKFAECSLGTLYREQNPKTGEFHGGPMYYITKGLGPSWKPLAIFFAFCTAIGSFGFANMFQANQVAFALDRYYSIPDWVTGLVLAALVGVTIIGGITRIGAIASKIVPLMCGIYLMGALYICLINFDRLPAAFGIIFSDAFSGASAAGGVIGTVVMIGVRRSIFSNEAGLGSAPIAHAAVKTDHPIREGVVASLGPAIDTILVCTCTAMVIILSGNYGSEMYESTFSYKIEEQTKQDFLLTGGWKVTSDEIPRDTYNMVPLEEGGAALTFAGGPRGGSAIAPPITVRGADPRALSKNSLKEPNKHVADGMRFSCNHQGGVRAVHLVDGSGKQLTSVSLGSEAGTGLVTDPKTGELVEAVSVNACSADGTWHSHVLAFTPAFKNILRNGGKGLSSLSFRFTAEPGTHGWSIDRLQAVRALSGIALTTASFDMFMQGWAGLLISCGVVFFCYSTMITWSYYGQTGLIFLFGERAALPYKIVFVICAFIGSVVKLSIILNFADLMTGLMVIPNTIAILMLSPVVVRETNAYFKRLKSGEFDIKPLARVRET
jgi:AGCS family alanine or glycine:cation symporter